MFALTADSQLKTILQCIVVRGHFLSEKQPNMAGCFEGEPEYWEHKRVKYTLFSDNREMRAYMDCVKRIWYLSHMRAAKVQVSLRICAVSPEPSLLARTSSESRGTFRQKARSLAPLNGWACAVKICHDGMLEDTNSLDGAHMMQSGVLAF